MWRTIGRSTTLVLVYVFSTSLILAYPLTQTTTVAADLINQFRNQHGLPSFQWNNQLASAAQQHADYMASVAFVDHYDAFGNRVDVRALNAGYSGRVTELIFGSSGDATRAVEWWQSSDLHRSLLLSQRYREIGIGATFGTNDGWIYWSVVLGDGIAAEVDYVESTITAPAAVEEADPAVLLPTATIIPTLTPIPTIISVPTVIMMAPQSTIPPAIIPTIETTKMTLSPSPTALAEIATNQISTSTTVETDDSIQVITDQKIPISTAPLNWWLVGLALFSIVCVPLLVYVWLGTQIDQSHGE